MIFISLLIFQKKHTPLVMKNDRFKHPVRGYNNEWVHIVAEQQAQTHQPAGETVHQLHNDVEQLRNQARRAPERAESFQSAWDTHLGPASKIEGHGTYQDYLEAQRRPQRLKPAKTPEPGATTYQQRQQMSQQRPGRDGLEQ